MPGAGAAREERTWAITTYFDPLGAKARLANFREFRKRLRIPLIAVEHAYGPSFELGEDDADILIQRRGGALLWQKERLLNLGLSALPDDCDVVVLLDCDIVFQRDDWVEAGRAALEDFFLIQPFRRVYHLSREDKHLLGRPAKPLEVLDSFEYLISRGKITDESFATQGASMRLKYSPGCAWMARRDLLDRHGIYDTLILGSGDKALASAAHGRHTDSARALGMNARHREHYLRWAEPFYQDVRGRVSYIDGDVLHLWHGALENRQYQNRYRGFEQYDFDPDADIVTNCDGVWRWKSDKPTLHAYTRHYFELRRDGQ